MKRFNQAIVFRFWKWEGAISALAVSRRPAIGGLPSLEPSLVALCASRAAEAARRTREGRKQNFRKPPSSAWCFRGSNRGGKIA
jgi:hypothetical protein